MDTLVWMIDEALSELWRTLFFLFVPPWIPLLIVWVRNSERHLLVWSSSLGMVGAILAHAVTPGAYLWSEALSDVGLVGTPAAALSGLGYGASVGLLFWGVIRFLRRLADGPGSIS
jgi:hypothetical protein